MATLVEGKYTAGENVDVSRYGETVKVTLQYPDVEPGRARFVHVDQESVRASDGVRLSYDYERDGWIIEQASRFSWNVDDEVADPDWQEVAFVRSWARQETDEEEADRLGFSIR